MGGAEGGGGGDKVKKQLSCGTAEVLSRWEQMEGQRFSSKKLSRTTRSDTLDKFVSYVFYILTTIKFLTIPGKNLMAHLNKTLYENKITYAYEIVSSELFPH